jgi:outer membrane protein assembly factor BamB
VLKGTLTRGEGKPADLPGAWPQFRGPQREGYASTPATLAREWGQGRPQKLWSVAVGEGYAGVAVWLGSVYLMDYDRAKQQDALRCLSLADGKEIWRFAYPVQVKRNHGMSRTVPTVTPQHIVAMGPKCHVLCLKTATGELQWGLDLVRQYSASVPPWYAGQCPLFDDGRVILGVGGKDALLLAVDVETGQEVWKTPNPRGWKMTHSSIVPVDFVGQRLYVYCGSGGVAGVSAKDGSIVWETTQWKISIATVPTPVVLEGGRIFLSGGYNAGSLMLQLKEENGRVVPQTLFALKPDVFGATQQTPIHFRGHLYGVRPDGQLICLSPEGRVVWASDLAARFGLGPFLIANDFLLAMNDSGLLTLAEATPSAYRQLAQAKVLNGQESWGPMALAGSRLIVRDLTELVCLEIGSVP